ncbi:helix-turn-helix domain-containing protein [Streptomyces sp. NPDC047315]|uniref:helix-turn-helix domain-containing protein n=1 Tax=Streptomyces sp. NPDC047315 TaxID=3155142 RepID=UPI0033DAEB86
MGIPDRGGTPPRNAGGLERLSALESETSDAEAFARRLRELRERSGHSYGALARRVGVSASTLHRYCSGHIVPLEFVPVERLARFCGCRGEDLVSLHRLWVLADGERRRRQASAAASAATAVTKTTETIEHAETTEVPEAKPEPEVEAGSEASGLAVSPKRWRRAARPTGVVAAATVLTLLVLPQSGHSPQSSAEAPGAPKNAAGPRYVGAAVPSPLASGPTATASAPPGATASRPPAGSSTSIDPGRTGSRTAPSEAAGAARSPSSALPFTWNVDDHIWANGCNHSYVVDRPPSAVPPPPSVSDAEPWATALGAVHGGDTLIRLTLQGRSEQAVVLQSIRVRVTAQRPPQRSNVYAMGMPCGGTLTPRMFDVDLDAARPVARSVPGNDSGTEIPAVSLPYRVSIRDPEVLLVTGRTVNCDCDWYLELEWSTSDRSGTVRIDDDGKPFRTSGVADAPAHQYDTTLRRWFQPSADNAPATPENAPAAPAAPPG